MRLRLFMSLVLLSSAAFAGSGCGQREATPLPFQEKKKGEHAAEAAKAADLDLADIKNNFGTLPAKFEAKSGETDTNPLTTEKVALGRQLFFDTRALEEPGHLVQLVPLARQVRRRRHEGFEGPQGPARRAKRALRVQRGRVCRAVLGRPRRDARGSGEGPDPEPDRDGHEGRAGRGRSARRRSRATRTRSRRRSRTTRSPSRTTTWRRRSARSSGGS